MTTYLLSDKIYDAHLYREWERDQNQRTKDLSFDDELLDLPPSDRKLPCVRRVRV